VAKPCLVTVNTIQPSTSTGNNGLSNTINFIIGNPKNLIPTVTSVSPTCAVVGNSLPITVTGTNFLTGPATSDPPQVSGLNWTIGSTQYQFNSSSNPAPTVTSTQITFTIPAADVSTKGNASVTVYNPPSLPVPTIPGSVGSGGGNSSPAQIVTVQTAPCQAAAKDGAAGPAASSASAAEETPSISLDGRYVAYTAIEDGHSQIFLRDTCEGASSACQPSTTLLSVAKDGSAGAADSHSPSMSTDGRYVAFSSAASNLVENAPPGRQVYLRDTCSGGSESCEAKTQLISTDSGGALLGPESILPSISSSGRFVAFLSITPSQSRKVTTPPASSSLSSPNSGYRHVFVRDTCLGAAHCTPKTTGISLQPGDNSDGGATPAGPALSGNAKHVAIPGATLATFFTRSLAVDDRIFLAVTNENK